MSLDRPPTSLMIGVSACLMGERTRYDGTDKRDAVVLELALHFELWAICPEVGAGLAAPREPMRLVRAPKGLALRGVTSRADHTALLEAYVALHLEEIATRHLAGFVLKNRSPSCGRAAVPIWDESGAPCGSGAGLYAAALMRHYPDLPIIEAEDLHNEARRREFIAAVSRK